MAEKEPVTELEPQFSSDDASPTPWAEARRRLAEADTYWLSTVRPGGRPHLVPVLAVWVDDALHFVASLTSRKAKNLAHNSHCVIATGSDGLDLVVEGEAAMVTDEAMLHRVADVYMSKYEWPVTVRDGALYGEGAPTAGPPPYEVAPTIAFGLATDERFVPTRWRF